VSNNLPSGATIPQLASTDYTVHYTNTSSAPQLIFLDPRQSTSDWVDLTDLVGDPTNMPLPTSGFTNPIYMVPADSTKLHASLNATAPVSFDFDPWTGDPDLYAQGANPTYTYAPSGGDVTPGFWGMFPSEIGPFGPSGADTTVTATPDLQAFTPLFDPTVSTDTGDFWSYINGLSGGWAPVEVDPGNTVAINVAIAPTAAIGTTVSGTINVDNLYLFSPFLDTTIGDGADQLASIPYSYKVGS
jgi:hypothetical protein